jgi:hypothetical protein
MTEVAPKIERFIYYLIVINLMGTSEYFNWYRSEIDRICDSYHEARALGQDSRAQELRDELYQHGYNHHQHMTSVLKFLKQKMNETKDPEVRGIFSNYIKKQSIRQEESAQDLNQFVLSTLGATE